MSRWTICLLAGALLFVGSLPALAFEAVAVGGTPYGVMEYRDLHPPAADSGSADGPSDKQQIEYIEILFKRLMTEDGPVKDKVSAIQSKRGCGRLDNVSSVNTIRLESSGWHWGFTNRYRTFLNWNDCGSEFDSRPVLGFDWEIDRSEPAVVTVRVFGMRDLSDSHFPAVEGVPQPRNGCVSECG